MISVIIPIYKAEAYLTACLDSLTAQTVTDWEAILVDDGSPDASGAICDAYARKDKRFIAIHQENAGVSAARNAGLLSAQGEYVAFLDADDRLAPDFLEKMLAAMGEGADLVFCNYRRVSPEGETLYTSSYDEKLKELIARFPEGSYPRTDEALAPLWAAGVLSACHSKLYRRSVIEKPFDISLSYAEDSLFVTEIACKAGGFAYVSEPLYLYLFREGSLSASWWEGMLTQRSRSLTAIADLFGKAGYPLAKASAERMRDFITPEPFLERMESRAHRKALLKEYCALPNYPCMMQAVRATRSRLTATVYALRSPLLLRWYLYWVQKRRG